MANRYRSVQEKLTRRILRQYVGAEYRMLWHGPAGDFTIRRDDGRTVTRGDADRCLLVARRLAWPPA